MLGKLSYSLIHIESEEYKVSQVNITNKNLKLQNISEKLNLIINKLHCMSMSYLRFYANEIHPFFNREMNY